MPETKCPLCDREKMKARVAHGPPMSAEEVESGVCLHPAHIYDLHMPPCESIGVQRIAKLRVKVAEWEAWSQQYENLSEVSKRWLHNSQEWDGAAYLGPMWQDLWNSAPSPTKPTKK